MCKSSFSTFLWILNIKKVYNLLYSRSKPRGVRNYFLAYFFKRPINRIKFNTEGYWGVLLGTAGYCGYFRVLEDTSGYCRGLRGTAGPYEFCTPPPFWPVRAVHHSTIVVTSLYPPTPLVYPALLRNTSQYPTEPRIIPQYPPLLHSNPHYSALLCSTWQVLVVP